MKQAARIFIVAAVIMATAVFFAFYLFSPVSKSEESIVFSVSERESLQSVADRLSEKRLIRHSLSLTLLGGAFYKMRTVKAGEYFIAPQESPFSIARKLAIGAPRKEKNISIPEGWTVQDIAAYLEHNGFFSQQEFMRTLQSDWGASYSFLAGVSTQTHFEGYLFPDTYRVFENASPRDIIKKMFDNFQKKFSDDFRKDAHEKGKSINEIIILASIIEREVRSDDDRAKIADIFYRRMILGMPLQADSTVNYITGKQTPSLSAADTLIDSPYNTYRFKGLPPSAICNPGLSSITAALYPQQNDFLYFLTKKDGSTAFSKTFEEHVQNKRQYLFSQ